MHAAPKRVTRAELFSAAQLVLQLDAQRVAARRRFDLRSGQRREGLIRRIGRDLRDQRAGVCSGEAEEGRAFVLLGGGRP